MNTDLKHPFYVEIDKREDGNSVLVTLKPELSNYHAILQYDERGNATVTIHNNITGEITLDMSLDNGEVFAEAA